jgi:hypothetical protein
VKTARTNVYRDGAVWCHATWIDGDFDSADPLDIADNADSGVALEAARAMLAGRVATHDVSLVADITTGVV